MITIHERSHLRPSPPGMTGSWHCCPPFTTGFAYAFRGLRPEAKQEAIQGSLANAAVAYARLHEQGRADIAYATPLANFAVRQFLAGRRVGGQLNLNDVMSRHAQRHHNLVVERLDRRDYGGEWKEILVEDRRFTPAETAAARIDFADWLSQLCRRDRGIATTLATGERYAGHRQEIRAHGGQGLAASGKAEAELGEVPGRGHRRCRRAGDGGLLIGQHSAPEAALSPAWRRGGLGTVEGGDGERG